MYTTKKAFCILIAAVMLMAVLPIASVASQIAEVRTEAYEIKKQSNAWLQFEAVEEEADRKGLSPKETTLAVYKAVLNNPNVDAGSLKWDGDNQFVFTIDGMHSAYCYRVRHTSCASAIGGKMLSDMKAMAMESSGGGNILLVEPYYGQDSIFTDDYFVQSQLLADYTGGAVTALVGSEATGPAIAANCVGKDIIFVHSHGARVDNSTYIYISNISGLTQNDYSRGWAICLGTNLAFIDGRYIKNHIPAQLSNCFIWMTICEGMALSTTGNALLEAGAGGVYGYSATVTVQYDAECEQLFWSDMRNGATTAEAIADIKMTIGAYDPYYSTQARPVVVSPVDSYPTNSYFTQTVNCTWTLPQGAATPTATPVVTPTATPAVTPTADPSAAPTATPTAAPTATPTPVPTATPTPAPTVAPSTTYYMPVTTIETNEDYLIGYDDGTNIYLLMNSNPNYNSVSGGYQYYYSANSKQYSYGIKAQRIGENVIDVDNSTYASATLNNVTWRFVSASGGYYIQSAADSGKYLYFIAADSLVPYKSKTAWNYSNGRLTAYSYNVCYLGTVGAYSNFFATGTSAGSNTNLKLYKKTVAAPVTNYTVTFKDWNGTVLKTEQVAEGGSATAPNNPTRTGYTFTGWDTAFNNITADTVVTAQYTINTYTVTFKDWDGTTLKTQTVNYGGAATAPNNPTRTGYTFTGWDKAFNNITADTVVTAQYMQNAVVNYYTVTFKDWDGTVLKTEQVAEGGAATAPNNPTRTGYTFTGWDKAFTNITANTVVTAQYTQNAATDKYMPAVSIVEGKDYVLGYNDGKNVYLIMNYNADPLTSAYETSSYRYIYSSNYYAYGVKAVLDESGNVVDVDRSIYPNACVENMKWNFIKTSKGYKIRSAKEPSMYLRAHANAKYTHLFISSGYYNATDWNWNYSQRLMSYKLSNGSTKYISYVPTVNGYRNFFKAGKNVGTVVLYRRVEQISSYVVSNDISNAGLCMNVN